MAAEQTFADRLRRLREARKMTQVELAGRAGVSPSLLAKLEQGQTDNPRLKNVLALARALGVSLDALAGGGPAPDRRKRGEGE